MSETIRIITAEPDSLSAYAQRIWNYRTLVATFALRDIKIKYAQTFLGIFWVVLQPFPAVIVFTFFFGKLIQVDTGVLPYPVFALIGLIGWNYFTGLAIGAGNALIDAQQVLKKISFPKLLLLLSKVVSAGVDFLIAFIVILVALAFYSVYPQWTILFLPFFILLNIVTGLTVGIWVSALTFRYRDLQHAAPFIINFLIWLTPVFYPVTILPEKFSYLMCLNPMALVIEGYRFSLTGAAAPAPEAWIASAFFFLLLATGLVYFKKIEDKIADYI